MKTVNNQDVQNAPRPEPLPVPVQTAYIVPPGSEPPLQNGGYQFGFRMPPGPSANTVGNARPTPLPTPYVACP